jgi:hypothetical protein
MPYMWPARWAGGLQNPAIVGAKSFGGADQRRAKMVEVPNLSSFLG